MSRANSAAGTGRKRKRIAGVALLAVAGAAAALAANDRFSADNGTSISVSVTTSTVDVRKTDVAERRFVSGALGYAGSYHVLASGTGTLTWLPPVGTVVDRGAAAYELDGKRVSLMYGSRPVWREFRVGMSDGPDVKQLEANLRELGFGANLTVDHHFSVLTYSAIRRWQRAAQLNVTGSVPLGQIVFLSNPVRIGGHDAQLGTQVAAGHLVAHGTTNEPAVTAQASPRQLSSIKVDTPVVVTLPDGKTRTGKITNVAATPTTSDGNGDTANTGDGGGSGQQDTVTFTARLDGEITGFVDQARVQITIIRTRHNNVLAVPITALNATPGGGYEVVLVDGTTTRRVPVRTGLFDEFTGLAEVSGDGLLEGQKVQVPRDDA